MFKKTEFDIELEAGMKSQRENLDAVYQKAFNEIEQTLGVIVKAVKHAEHNNFRSNRLIWNVAGYIDMVSYDLKIIGKELSFATNEWQKRYFGRQACMLIYELLNDIPELVGKDFRNELLKLADSSVLIAQLNTVSKSLNEFKKENFERLKQIRNVATAHRDKDIFEQLKIIESIKWEESLNYVFKITDIMRNFGSLLQKAINRSSDELDR